MDTCRWMDEWDGMGKWMDKWMDKYIICTSSVFNKYHLLIINFIDLQRIMRL